MIHTCFLGANTPEGFRSEYDGLQTDPRIRQLRILKGGSGCGKSTLMRRVAEQAGLTGLETEQIPCSSDPDSLDGLVIPELGLAIVDGTAPHVVEPKLCGCGANYVNLGRYYNEALLRDLQPALRAAKAANSACYPPAYGALAAAAGVRRMLRSLADQAGAPGLLFHARELLLKGLPPRAEAAGSVRRCYLTAVTPAGLRTCLPDCQTLWAVRDGFGLAGGLIRDRARAWRAAGEETVLSMDPMEPGTACGLFLPGRELGYWRVDPVFDPPRPNPLLDLETPVLQELPAELQADVQRLNELRKKLIDEAVFWLRRAKEHHDVLEDLYRPAVDFSGVEREAEAILRGIFDEVDGQTFSD